MCFTFANMYLLFASLFHFFRFGFARLEHRTLFDLSLSVSVFFGALLPLVVKPASQHKHVHPNPPTISLPRVARVDFVPRRRCRRRSEPQRRCLCEKVRHGSQSGARKEEAEAGRPASGQREAPSREGGQRCGGCNRSRGQRPGQGLAPRFGRDAELAGRGARLGGAVVVVVGELGGIGQFGDGNAGRQSADDQSECVSALLRW